MEHAIAVIAVNDKLMATAGALSTETHRALVVQLVPYHLLPSLDGISGTVDVMGGL